MLPDNNIDKHIRNTTFITTREAYDFYREHRHKVAKSIDQYNYFVKAVEGLFTVIHNMLVDSQGGVYMPGFGYFAYVRFPKKMKVRTKSLIKHRKEKYFPYFFPDKALKKWTMDRAFKIQVRKHSYAQNIEKKLHFDLCKSYRTATIEANKNANARKT